MPTNLTDVSAFTDPIVAPADSDPQAAAAYVPGYQGLANRTRFLRDYCTDTGIVLPAPVLWTRYLGVDSFRPFVESQFSRPNDTVRQAEADSALGFWDLTPVLARNAELVRVRALVDPAVARATVGLRMTARLIRYSFGVSFAAPTASTTTIATATDDGTTALQWIEIDLTGAPESVAAGAAWGLELACGADAATNKDHVYAAMAEFNGNTIRNN